MICVMDGSTHSISGRGVLSSQYELIDPTQCVTFTDTQLMRTINTSSINTSSIYTSSIDTTSFDKNSSTKNSNSLSVVGLCGSWTNQLVCL
jgi:hypothetical protein